MFSKEDLEERAELTEKVELAKAIISLESNADFKKLTNYLFKVKPLIIQQSLYLVANDEVKRNNAMQELTALSQMRNTLKIIKDVGKSAQIELETTFGENNE